MYICIEGNIGAGKTTLAIELAKELNAHYLAERFEENALLPLFYKQPKTFAFPTEYSFLIDRHKQLDYFFNNKKKSKIVVADFHFDKCICFAKANLSAKDFVFYKKHFKALQQTLPLPGIIVYLTTTPNLLMSNIQKRGRQIEKSLKVEYLEKLKKTLDTYYLTKQKTNTLVLPLIINEYNNETLKWCCTEVIKALKKVK